MPFETVGQQRLFYLALMFLERRDVRVAKHRKTVRPQFYASGDSVEARCDGLVRQSIDQVEVDAGDTGAPETCGCGGGDVETLHPVDGALHDRIEALHAEACPIDAAVGKRLDHLWGEPARIDLYRDFGRGADKERMPDRPDQVGEGFWCHDGRRSAAEMDVVNPKATIDLPRYQIDFAAERRGIDGNRLVTASDRGVAAAIPAHGPAERNMQVQRHAGVTRNGL
jgi:hypothetical protein